MPAESNDSTADPFRQWRWWAWAVGGTVVVTAVAWCVWAAVARHRLHRAIGRITDRGQPFDPNDFRTPPLPDSQNAVVAWKAAFAAVPANDFAPENSNLVFTGYPPPPAWFQLADQSVVVCAAALTSAHSAAAVTGVDWGPRDTWPAVSMSRVPFLNCARNLAVILVDAAEWDHLRGRDADALAKMTDALSLADVVGRQQTLTGYVSAIGIRSMVALRLDLIAPDLSVDPTTRVRLSQLIRSLSVSDPIRQWGPTGTAVGTADARVLFDVMRTGVWLLRPAVELAEVRWVDDRELDGRAEAATNAADAQAIYPPEKPTEKSSALQRLAPTEHLPSPFEVEYRLNNFMRLKWQLVAESNTTAVALAVRLYRQDHGLFPAQLTELVPEYLAAVPADPFRRSGTPIGYNVGDSHLPDGRPRHVLYFDPAPAPSTAPTTANYRWLQTGTQWRDLDRW